MCGRFNVSDDPLVQGLLGELGIPLRIEPRVNIAPGAKAQIVYETHQGRTLQDAIWSLLIERKPDGTGYRPSPKYSTFNARSGSLGTSPLWKKRFHSQRAIIPASGFHEWTGEKGHKQCYNIHPADSAIAFAGLMSCGTFRKKWYRRSPSSPCHHTPGSATSTRKASRSCSIGKTSTCGWTQA